MSRPMDGPTKPYYTCKMLDFKKIFALFLYYIRDTRAVRKKKSPRTVSRTGTEKIGRIGRIGPFLCAERITARAWIRQGP